MMVFLLVLLLLLPREYLVIFIHEMGHLICAFLVKMKVSHFIVGRGQLIIQRRVFGIWFVLNRLRNERKVWGVF